MNVLMLVKLIVDSGLLILIWLVQLVIYPGFYFYNNENLKVWHKIYTQRVTLVVLPLMLSQLILSIWLLVMNVTSAYHIVDALLVVFTWLSTFIIFVPLHQKIDAQQSANLKAFVLKLVRYNWLRTAIWSLIFVLTLYQVIF